MKQKYLQTNLVYGATYANLFLNFHLRSILDKSNLPAIADQYVLEYAIFTDDETVPILTANKNFQRLAKLCEDSGGGIAFIKFEWPKEVTNRFDQRYGALVQMFKASADQALKQNAWLTAWVADLVVAKGFYSKILKKIEDGHGAVFVLPPRGGAEGMVGPLGKGEEALEAKELFTLVYENMHPLWQACHWDTPQFSKLPFSLLWNSGTGLLARSFSITPIIIKPSQKMTEGRGMIDGDIPAMCENPYWCEDWTEAPVCGAEPIQCYFPAFINKTSDIPWVKQWSSCLDQTQLPLLKHKLYYPDKVTANISDNISFTSDHVVNGILGGNNA